MERLAQDDSRVLEKPDLADERLVACLWADYRLNIRDITFLPLGADANTAVYRAADQNSAYFLKLRRGRFDEATVAIPRFLLDQGVPHIIAPLRTSGGQLWARVDEYAILLFPFVAGRDGHAMRPSGRQWSSLGAVLHAIHSMAVPPVLTRSVPREAYAPHWRDRVRAWQARIEATHFEEPVSAELAAFIRAERATIDDLVTRAERLARRLQAASLNQVLCHGDMHAANLLIDRSGHLYLVDWDTVILAPKERDLMFIGAGLGICDTPEEQGRFYEGYGPVGAHPTALAYYRYERIIEDIAAFCDEIMAGEANGADRERALEYLAASFRPGQVVEIAYRLDALGGE